MLRLNPLFKNTLVVFLAALSDEYRDPRTGNRGRRLPLTKPVSPKVLVSKVNALFRRMHKDEPAILKVSDLEIDREKYM